MLSDRFFMKRDLRRHLICPVMRQAIEDGKRFVYIAPTGRPGHYQERLGKNLIVHKQPSKFQKQYVEVQIINSHLVWSAQ
jgi:hypothetical protein